MYSNILKNKKGLVMGIANDMSIAWHIAKTLTDAGAELYLSYPNDVMKSRVITLGEKVSCTNFVECDVADENSVNTACDTISKTWDEIDFIVHAVAFSDKNELRGRYVDNTSLANFLNTMNISCYSLTAITKRLAPMMKNGGSIITLSYYGAEKVVQNYNVMGVAKSALETSVKYLAADLGVNNIRVNTISAGPVRTLAASGIADFRKMMTLNEKNTPLRRNVSGEEIGKTALFLLSDMSSGVTGETIHVDCGYHIIGMVATEEEIK